MLLDSRFYAMKVMHMVQFTLLAIPYMDYPWNNPKDFHGVLIGYNQCEDFMGYENSLCVKKWWNIVLKSNENYMNI